MRIVAGSAKGTKLAPVPDGVRPMSDRAREGLFASLGARVLGARVLDLFAGTGATGIEALSRGGDHAVFVERSRPALKAIRENLERAKVVQSATVVAADAHAYLGGPPRASGPFDLVLCDPPYELGPPQLDEVLRELHAGVVGRNRLDGGPDPGAPEFHACHSATLVRREGTALRRQSPDLVPARRPGGMMGLTALCPGTFDPVTNGHLDIIGRTSATFEHVVVAVLENPSKQPLFSAAERVSMLEEACSELPNVRVGSFKGLLVSYAREQGPSVIVKGLRAVSDYEFEIQMAQMNHRLGEVETLFMPTNPRWSFLSSSLVKEVARFGGNVEGLVPDAVRKRLVDRVGEGS